MFQLTPLIPNLKEGKQPEQVIVVDWEGWLVNHVLTEEPDTPWNQAVG